MKNNPAFSEIFHQGGIFMKRILFVAVIYVVFAVPSFAQTANESSMYLTIDNYLHKDLAYDFSESYIDIPADPNYYHNPGFTLGYQTPDYFAYELSLSFLPDDMAAGDGLIDFAIILQKPFEKNGSGFRPYFGVGVGFIWGSEYDISLFGGGWALKGGLRAYKGPFLIGVGADFHYYAASLSDGYDSVNFSYFTIKYGLNVGCVF